MLSEPHICDGRAVGAVVDEDVAVGPGLQGKRDLGPVWGDARVTALAGEQVGERLGLGECGVAQVVDEQVGVAVVVRRVADAADEKDLVVLAGKDGHRGGRRPGRHRKSGQPNDPLRTPAHTHSPVRVERLIPAATGQPTPGAARSSNGSCADVARVFAGAQPTAPRGAEAGSASRSRRSGPRRSGAARRTARSRNPGPAGWHPRTAPTSLRTERRKPRRGPSGPVEAEVEEAHPGGLAREPPEADQVGAGREDPDEAPDHERRRAWRLVHVEDGVDASASTPR